MEATRWVPQAQIASGLGWIPLEFVGHAFAFNKCQKSAKVLVYLGFCTTSQGDAEVWAFCLALAKQTSFLCV